MGFGAVSSVALVALSMWRCGALRVRVLSALALVSGVRRNRRIRPQLDARGHWTRVQPDGDDWAASDVDDSEPGGRGIAISDVDIPPRLRTLAEMINKEVEI